MDIGKLLEKFIDSIIVRITVVLAILIILLVIELRPSAGENIINVLMAVGTLAGVSRIATKQGRALVPHKKDNDSRAKQTPSQDS